MKRLGGPRTWLTTHIVLDFVGPLLVLVHAGLLTNPKFIDLNWIARSVPNLAAGIPAILAPMAMASGTFGRYLYRRLPAMHKEFRHWRNIHLVLTAILYFAGVTHVLINTKGFEQLVKFPED